MSGVLEPESAMFSFKNIFSAYMQCRKNKRNTHNALEFELDLVQNLWNLHNELNTRTYKIGRSICFLTTSPKLREVFAADFRDRIVHHIVVKALEKIYEPKFISDVYNNRKSKGIHNAMKKAQSYMNATYGGYYLQLDIKGFFYNLDKNILFKQLFKNIDKNNTELLWIVTKILYHNPTRSYVFKGDIKKLDLLPAHKTLFKIPPSRGLPIGNLTSQFFANVYMNDFDNFVKRVLKVKHYIRYVDDFVLFDRSKEKLEYLKVEIEKQLQEKLSLELRADSKLKKHSQGLDFLGYVIRENYVLTRRRVVNNYKYKKAKYLDEYEKQRGKMKRSEIKSFLSVKASFESHIKHSNSYNLNKKIGAIHESNPFDYDRV
ncbi:MAG: reverse transcriptase/maturase family protein [Campylobacterota bacterium]|nr:reverse transcriptase/maturase family protein [Campylobacterota bacterium]